MITFNEYLDTLVDFLVANPVAPRTEAVDHLQLVASISNAQGNDFMTRLGVYYFDSGLIPNGNYTQFRDYIAPAPAASSKFLLQGLAAEIVKLPEAAVVNNGILTKNINDRKAEINNELDYVADIQIALPITTDPVDATEEGWYDNMAQTRIDALEKEKKQLGL